MTTLAEMCEAYDIPLESEQEKVASQDSEAAQLQEEVNNSNTDGGEDMGLSELYEALNEDEMEKEAGVEENEETELDDEGLEKLAEDYVAAGRFMARGFYDELEKLAAIPEQKSDSEKREVMLHAEGANKTQRDDDSKLAVNTPEARNANADALKEKYVNAMVGKGGTKNVSGAVGEDHKVAPDAAK